VSVAGFATFTGICIHRIETDSSVNLGGDIVGGVVHIVDDVDDVIHTSDTTDDVDARVNVGVVILLVVFGTSVVIV